MAKYWLKSLVVATALLLGSCAADLRPTLTPQPGAGQKITYDHGTATIILSAVNRVEVLIIPNEFSSSQRMSLAIGVHNETKEPFDFSSEDISVRFLDDGSPLHVIPPAQIREEKQRAAGFSKFMAALSNFADNAAAINSPNDTAYAKMQREESRREGVQSADRQRKKDGSYFKVLLERETLQPGKEAGGVIEIDIPQRFSTTRPIEISVRAGAEVHKVLLTVNFSEVN